MKKGADARPKSPEWREIARSAAAAAGLIAESSQRKGWRFLGHSLGLGGIQSGLARKVKRAWLCPMLVAARLAAKPAVASRAIIAGSSYRASPMLDRTRR